RAERNGAAKSTTTAAPARCPLAGRARRWLGGCRRRGGRFTALGDSLRCAQIADLARELDLISGDLARIDDAKLVALETQQLDEGDVVAFHLAFLQVRFPLLTVELGANLACQGSS